MRSHPAAALHNESLAATAEALEDLRGVGDGGALGREAVAAQHVAHRPLPIIERQLLAGGQIPVCYELHSPVQQDIQIST